LLAARRVSNPLGADPAKRYNGKMATSKKDASMASKLLRKSKSKKVKSVAGSDLAQAKRHKKRR
jgi:hypothetical protein